MAQFKAGDKVVHLGATASQASRNRGKVLTILEGPRKIVGFTGVRYIVDKPLFMPNDLTPDLHHADERYLLLLK